MKYNFKKLVECHKSTEIYPGFFICSENQFYKTINNGKEFDIIIPLDGLDGRIWDYFAPEKIQIFYFPINDFSILPENALDYLVTHIVKFIKEKKKVIMFCNGGHGRTGYITACVLGKLGIKNPVEVVKNKYCEKAIESLEQYYSIELYLGIDCSKYTYELMVKDFKTYIIPHIIDYFYQNEKNKKLSTPEIYNYLYDFTLQELIDLCQSLNIKIPDYYSRIIDKNK